MLGAHGAGVARQVGDRVGVGRVAFVPVVGEGFVAGGVLEGGGGVAGDGVEGFEDGAGEEAFGVFGGFVGHEAIDEGPGGWGGDDAAEGGVEEVGVVANGLVETSGALVGEDCEVDAVAVLLTEFVQGGKLRDLDQVVITAVEGVSVGGCGKARRGRPTIRTDRHGLETRLPRTCCESPKDLGARLRGRRR